MMAHPLAPNFQRFLPAWLVFGSSVSLAAFLMMVTSAALTPLDPDSTADAPPAFLLLAAVFIYFAALAAGLFLVPFRRLIVGPRFPFARRGYGLVAALPLAALALVELTWGQRLVIVGGLEIFLAVSALIFIGLGRMFGAFDEAER
ncbi:MAG: hypothetical protein EPO51_16510 [Phenylobacterium sp.]|uniref:hypothetical protein n=1 Tax=Phenylobacterium sp. TaxID=1871053 RepID=UPI00122BDAE7|nr:hypothetical protein [Phenylobacterium sp.]TAJ70691.1 MAG: hypothetical protein EPO51_16510 [Phenylobacterium sp.]